MFGIKWLHGLGKREMGLRPSCWGTCWVREASGRPKGPAMLLGRKPETADFLLFFYAYLIIKRMFMYTDGMCIFGTLDELPTPWSSRKCIGSTFFHIYLDPPLAVAPGYIGGGGVRVFICLCNCLKKKSEKENKMWEKWIKIDKKNSAFCKFFQFAKKNANYNYSFIIITLYYSIINYNYSLHIIVRSGEALKPVSRGPAPVLKIHRHKWVLAGAPFMINGFQDRRQVTWDAGSW